MEMKCSLKSNLNFTVATANQIEISTKKSESHSNYV